MDIKTAEGLLKRAMKTKMVGTYIDGVIVFLKMRGLMLEKLVVGGEYCAVWYYWPKRSAKAIARLISKARGMCGRI
ncbi:MAG: hypothetical protein JZD41_07635 [Thermoproteus sp.]|nr:hypothetical protein [Thermoproteus sp.]